MRHQDIKCGREYLTRDVRITGVFGVSYTRGHVRVTGPCWRSKRGKRYFNVLWLMRDGSERKDHRLPRALEPRRFMVEVPRG